MFQHVFVDESKKRGLLIAAAALSTEDVAIARRTVVSLHLPRQRRIHFKDEGTHRKQKILDALAELPVDLRLYDCPSERHELTARCARLVRIVEDLAARGRGRLIIETDDSTMAHDRRALYQAGAKIGARREISYHHMRATEEPLLALPDTFGWCWVAGGMWRHKVRERVVEHVSL